MERLTSESFWNARWDRARGREWMHRVARRSRWRREFCDCLAGFVDRASSGADPTRVIELGCASGRMLVDISSLRPGVSLAGIDYALHGLERARETLARHHLEADLFYGDVFELELPQKYDLVFS